MVEAHPAGTQARRTDDQGTDQRGPQVLILDASAALALLFHDERGPLTDAVLACLERSTIVVPAHWILEVTNGLLLPEKRGRLRHAGEDIEILERLAALKVRVDEQTSAAGWRDTLVLARHCSLTTYNAAYLELSLRLQGALATADRALAEAAKQAGVTVVAG